MIIFRALASATTISSCLLLGQPAIGASSAEDDQQFDVVTAASECGLPSENVTFREDADLEDNLYMVKVGPDGQYRSEALCLAYWNATVSRFIEFDDKFVQTRQRESVERQSKFISLITAESWLGGAELRAQQRPFDAKTETIQEYLQFIERSCKAAAGSLLKFETPTAITFELQSLVKMDEKSIWRFSCANQMMALSEIEKAGYSFGFVGWEAERVEEQK